MFFVQSMAGFENFRPKVNWQCIDLGLFCTVSYGIVYWCTTVNYIKLHWFTIGLYSKNTKNVYNKMVKTNMYQDVYSPFGYLAGIILCQYFCL